MEARIAVSNEEPDLLRALKPPYRVATGGSPRRRPGQQQVASNGVVAIVIFIIAEAMFFAGLISAHTIGRTTAIGGWPPPGQPRLPIEETAFNTLALLASGVMMVVARKAFAKSPERALWPLWISTALGVFFVVLQGVEWVALLGEGLTVTSSTHGAFFYLIVGAHALHALGAIAALLFVCLRLRSRRVTPSQFRTTELFWYFVVCLWPILYWRVYL